MNIPEKIRVLHQTYQISEVDNLHDGADDLYGQVRYLEERILLNSGASGEAKKAALIHETIHVIDEMFQIGLEEKQVEQLGVGIYNLIRDNPEMFISERRPNE